MAQAVTALLVVTGVLHLLPLVGVLSSERVGGLYGISVQEPNLEILMRHRAVLFGLLGAFLILAGFDPSWQPAGLVAGFVSVTSFLVLARSVGGCNAALRRVVVADRVLLLCLVVAAVLWGLQARSGAL